MAEVIVGEQLKALRTEAVKQADLVARLRATGVEALQISQQRYSDWEGGARPPYEALVALADFWGVELRWLMTGEGPRERVQPEDAVVRLEVVERVLTSDINQLKKEEELRRTIPQFAEQIAAHRRTLTAAQNPPTPAEHPEDDGGESGGPTGPEGGKTRSTGG